MDGDDKQKVTAPKPDDAAETVLAEGRGDKVTPPAPGADKVDGQPAAATDGKGLVDMTSKVETTLPAKAEGDDKTVPATINGDEIVFTPGPPGQPDTTGDGKPKDPKVDADAAAEAKLKGAVTADGAFDATYNAVEDPNKIKLPPDVEKEIAAKMEAYQKELAANNFTITFAKGEGPNPAMFRQQKEAIEKQKAGKELSPQEKAVMGLTSEDIRTEAIRMRDRDFKVLKTEDGKPRNWYIKDEPSQRWSNQELKEKMAAQEKTLREGAAKKIAEAEEKQRQLEAENKAKELAAAIEKNVPAESMVKDAATKAGVEGDPKAIRDAMKAQVEKDVASGALKPEDLTKPYPRVGAALVGTGALTSEELKSALDKQTELKTAAEAKGEKGPRLDAVLKDIYKDNPEKLAQLDKSSNFYDELKKIVDADLAAKKTAADAPPADPFSSQFNDVPKTVTAPDKVVAPPGGAAEVPPPSGPTELLPPEKTPPVVEGENKDVNKEVTEKPVREGAVTDLKQAPSGYLALRAFSAGGLEGRTWTASNDSQKAVVDALNNQALRDELPKISPDILDGIASVGDAKPINDFFARKNLDLKVENLGENDIALASTLNVKGQWAGTRTEIEVGGKKVPAVALKDAPNFQVGDKTVVQLYNNDGIEVYATPMEKDASGEELLAAAKDLTPTEANSKPGTFKGARLPMVKMDAQTKLDGLVGMQSDKGETITSAEMQTKLNIDEHGFSVDQGLAVVATRSVSFDEPFTFDKPFMLWVKTKDGSQPLTAIRVDERFFKDPKGTTTAPKESTEN